MNKKRISLFGVSLLLVATLAYGQYGSSADPEYVTDAKSAVSSKMSYSYGANECKASEVKIDEWNLDCMPQNGQSPLRFSVYPASKAPYDVPTSFYLVAKNDEARNGAKVGLLTYLMINTAQDVQATKPENEKAPSI